MVISGVLGLNVAGTDKLIRIESACGDCQPGNPYYVIESSTVTKGSNPSIPYSVNGPPAFYFAFINHTVVDPTTGSATINQQSIPDYVWQPTVSTSFQIGIVPSFGSSAIVTNSRFQIVLGPELVWNASSDTSCSVNVMYSGIGASCVFSSSDGFSRYRVVDVKIPTTIVAPSAPFANSIVFPYVLNVTIENNKIWPAAGFNPSRFVGVLYTSIQSDPSSAIGIAQSYNMISMPVPAVVNNGSVGMGTAVYGSQALARIMRSGRTGDGERPFVGQVGNIANIRIRPERPLVGSVDSWILLTLPVGYQIDMVASPPSGPPLGVWTLISPNQLKYTLVNGMLLSAGLWIDVTISLTNPPFALSRSDRVKNLWTIQTQSSGNLLNMVPFDPNVTTTFLGSRSVISQFRYSNIRPTLFSSIQSALSGLPFPTSQQYLSVFFRTTLGMSAGDMVIIMGPSEIDIASCPLVVPLEDKYYFSTNDPVHDLVPLSNNQRTDVYCADTRPITSTCQSCTGWNFDTENIGAKIVINRLVDPGSLVGFLLEITLPLTVPTVRDWNMYITDSKSSPIEGSRFPVRYDGFMDYLDPNEIPSDNPGSFRISPRIDVYNGVFHLASTSPFIRTQLPTTVTASGFNCPIEIPSDGIILVTFPPGYILISGDNPSSLGPPAFEIMELDPATSQVTPRTFPGVHVEYPLPHKMMIKMGTNALHAAPYKIVQYLQTPSDNRRYATYSVILEIYNPAAAAGASNGRYQITDYPYQTDTGIEYGDFVGSTFFGTIPPIATVVNSHVDCANSIVSASSNEIVFRFRLSTALGPDDFLIVTGDQSTSQFVYDRYMQPGNDFETNAIFEMLSLPGSDEPFKARARMASVTDPLGNGSIESGRDYLLRYTVSNPNVTTIELGSSPNGPVWTIETNRDYRQIMTGCPILNPMPTTYIDNDLTLQPNRDDRPGRSNFLRLVSDLDFATVFPPLTPGSPTFPILTIKVTYPPHFIFQENCAGVVSIVNMTITDCRATLVDEDSTPGQLILDAQPLADPDSMLPPSQLNVTVGIFRNPYMQPKVLDFWYITVNGYFVSMAVPNFRLKQFEFLNISESYHQVSSLSTQAKDSFPVTFTFMPRNALPITNTGPLQVRQDALGLTFGELNITRNSGFKITAPEGFIFDNSGLVEFNDFRQIDDSISHSRFGTPNEVFFNKTGRELTVVFVGNRSMESGKTYQVLTQLIPPTTVPLGGIPDWFIQSFSPPNISYVDEIRNNNFTDILATRMKDFSVTVLDVSTTVSNYSTVLNTPWFNRGQLLDRNGGVRVSMTLTGTYYPTGSTILLETPDVLFQLRDDGSGGPPLCYHVEFPNGYTDMIAECFSPQTMSISGGSNLIPAGMVFSFNIHVRNPTSMRDSIMGMYWVVSHMGWSGDYIRESYQARTWRVFSLLPVVPELAISGSNYGSGSYTNLTVSLTASMEANFIHLNVTEPRGFNFSDAQSGEYDIYKSLTLSCWNCIGMTGVEILPGIPISIQILKVRLGDGGGSSKFGIRTFYLPPGAVVPDPFKNSTMYREEAAEIEGMFTSGISNFLSSYIVSDHHLPTFTPWTRPFPINPRVNFSATAIFTFNSSISSFALPNMEGQPAYINTTYIRVDVEIFCPKSDYKMIPDWPRFSITPSVGNLTMVPAITQSGTKMIASFDSAIYFLENKNLASQWTVSVPVVPISETSNSFWTINVIANGTTLTTNDGLSSLPQNSSYVPVRDPVFYTDLNVLYPVSPVIPRPNSNIIMRFSLTRGPPLNTTNFEIIAPSGFVITSVLTVCQANSPACGTLPADKSIANKVTIYSPMGKYFNHIVNFEIDFRVTIPTDPVNATSDWIGIVYSDPALSGQLVRHWGEYTGLHVDFNSEAMVVYGSMSALRDVQLLLIFSVREPNSVSSLELVSPIGVELDCDSIHKVVFFNCTLPSSLSHGVLLNRTYVSSADASTDPSATRSSGFMPVGDFVMPITATLPLLTPAYNFFDVIMRDATGSVVDGVYSIAGRPIVDSSYVSVSNASVKMNTTQVGSRAQVSLSFTTLKSTTAVDAITITFPTHYYHQITSQNEVKCVNRKFPKAPVTWVDLSSTQSITFLVDDTRTGLIEMSTGQAIVLNRIPASETFVFQFPITLPHETPTSLNFWTLSFCRDRKKIDDCLNWKADSGLTHIPIVGDVLTAVPDATIGTDSIPTYALREGLSVQGLLISDEL